MRGIVHQVLQFFAGLEERNLFRGNFHPLSGLGIAPDARFALARTEAAKAANLDLVTRAQRSHYAVKDRFYDHFTIFARKFCQTRDFVNQISFRHNPSRLVKPCLTFSNFRGCTQVTVLEHWEIGLGSQVLGLGIYSKCLHETRSQKARPKTDEDLRPTT
jgi:hypothetical protein